MEKQTYYVTVDIGSHVGQIRDQLSLNDPNYDFEIEATEDEIHQLEELFERTQEDDFKTFIVAHLPYQTKERAKMSRREDNRIRQIYQMIYRLGTEETKKRMREAGMVQESAKQ